MSQFLQRSYYQASSSEFLSRDADAILGELVKAHSFATDIMQRGAWQHQIGTVKKLLRSYPSADVLFEFSIPRMGKRADVVLLAGGIIFVLEYKVGEDGYPRQALDQALDYATDLKNFHEGSHLSVVRHLELLTAFLVLGGGYNLLKATSNVDEAAFFSCNFL